MGRREERDNKRREEGNEGDRKGEREGENWVHWFIQSRLKDCLI